MTDENTTEQQEPKVDFDLDLHTYRLLTAEQFFAALSRRMHKVRTTAIPTAGVRMNPDTANFEMLYNPKFFADIPDNQKLGVLMHEMYHIIFEHVTGKLPPEGMNKMWNIATDLAINSHIMDDLPEAGCIPIEDASSPILLVWLRNGITRSTRQREWRRPLRSSAWRW